MTTEYNYKKKITYYLGAGASANAIPMVSGINEYLNHLNEFVEKRVRFQNNNPMQIGASTYDSKTLIEFSSFLNKWYHKVKTAPSIDTYAKRLFDNNKQKEYLEYKVFLTIAFHFFHFYKKNTSDINLELNSLDGRYENLFRSINSIQNYFGFNTIIPHCFNFITWNYDFQFEYSRVLDCINEGTTQDTKIKTFYESMVGRFIKLNGSALLDKLQHGDYKSRMSINLFDELFNLLFLIYHELINQEKEITTFRFSWENKVDLDNLSEIAQKTDILVVIGYSFPSFNRMIDRVFYSNLKEDCVIYTQGRDMQDSMRIKNYFEQCFLPKQKPRDIVPVESPFFFVPPHFFEPNPKLIGINVYD
jgi:hypothetical protein